MSTETSWQIKASGQWQEVPDALARLREPFPAHQVSLLPKQQRKDDQDRGRCEPSSRYSADQTYCGGWHARSVHLSYVGHAALTDRLLEVDPVWSWEPLAFTDKGLPATDQLGGLWIRLTVCGVARLGYGDAQGKTGPNAVKEAIGDALRNAAMRFGAALDLWHRGDLHEAAQEQTPQTPAGGGTRPSGEAGKATPPAGSRARAVGTQEDLPRGGQPAEIVDTASGEVTAAHAVTSAVPNPQPLDLTDPAAHDALKAEAEAGTPGKRAQRSRTRDEADPFTAPAAGHDGPLASLAERIAAAPDEQTCDLLNKEITAGIKAGRLDGVAAVELRNAIRAREDSLTAVPA